MNEKNLDLIKMAQDIARIGSWEFDVKKQTCRWSEITYQIHELEVGTPIDFEKAINFYVEEHRPIIQACAEAAINDGTPWNIELKIKSAKGNVKWIRAIGRAVKENGELIRLEGVFQDIDEVKTKSIKLQNNFEKIRTYEIALAQHSIVARTDMKGKIIYVNNKFCQISGYSREELIGNTHKILNSGYHPKDFFKEMWKCITSKQLWRGEIKNRAKDGSFYWVDTTISPILDDKGDIIEFLAIRNDITKLKNSEEIQNDLNTRLTLALKVAKVGVWDWNVTNDAVIWDKNMFEIYGLKEENFPSAYDAWEKGLHPDDKERIETEVQVALSKEKEFNTQFRVVTEEGEVKIIRALAIVLRNEKKEPVRMVGTNWDVTEEHRQKESLENLNEELVQFAYRTSHDLKSPLFSMKGLVALALESIQSQEYELLEKDLQSVDGLIDRLSQLIQDMMDLTKIDHLEKTIEPFYLEKEILDIFENHRYALEQEKIEVQSDIQFQEAILVDGPRVRHILENLISNSIKYNDDNKTNKEILVKAKKRGLVCTIDIIDNGVGIDQEHHGDVFKMFKRFYQKKHGTGLGLYMVKKNVESLGGSIDFSSDEKQTIFTFTIPIKEK